MSGQILLVIRMINKINLFDQVKYHLFVNFIYSCTSLFACLFARFVISIFFIKIGKFVDIPYAIFIVKQEDLKYF